jgi:hypothetical protein
MSEQQTEKMEWVILEAMGHNRVAGLYFFENGLHRVDVPDPAEPGRFIRTERYGQSAIFRITSVDEATARLIAKQCVIPEAIPWEARRELAKLAGPGETREALPVPKRVDNDDIPDDEPPHRYAHFYSEDDNDDFDDHPYDETGDYEDRLEDTEEQDGYTHS